eukprot:TRINITY_DN32621_c0_g1_i1.p1 TRINITY_DN32621_c0_g1~~TRINITY_DN32621_c0_g1_i1.p1  ORF type:complete len:400 (+),score=124.12 TRINITY_DN32621_c0_g1_i1:50-1249(+)
MARAAAALVMLLWCASAARACDVFYDFGEYTAGTLATRMDVTLTMWQITPRSMAAVYLSTATGTGCNPGYFGAIFNPNKTSLLFSMWDTPAPHVNSTDFEFQGLPASATCKRNALDTTGKTIGVQCGLELPDVGDFALGVPYTFTIMMTAQNASGALWEASMHDPVNERTWEIGAMFFVDAPMGLPADQCRSLGHNQNPPSRGLGSYTFMEYFAAPRRYLTVATWSDMTATSPDGRHQYRPVGTGGECCGHSDPDMGGPENETSMTCQPPQCDSPAITFTCGPHVEIPLSVQEANPTCLKTPPPHRCLGGAAFCPRPRSENTGSCATKDSAYPTALFSNATTSREECEALCASHGDGCAAFALSSTPSPSSCTGYPAPAAQYLHSNGYPGVTCYLRPFN